MGSTSQCKHALASHSQKMGLFAVSACPARSDGYGTAYTENEPSRNVPASRPRRRGSSALAAASFMHMRCCKLRWRERAHVSVCRQRAPPHLVRRASVDAKYKLAAHCAMNIAFVRVALDVHRLCVVRCFRYRIHMRWRTQRPNLHTSRGGSRRLLANQWRKLSRRERRNGEVVRLQCYPCSAHQPGVRNVEAGHDVQRRTEAAIGHQSSPQTGPPALKTCEGLPGKSVSTVRG
jgi:hypothetical protein